MLTRRLNVFMCLYKLLVALCFVSVVLITLFGVGLFSNVVKRREHLKNQPTRACPMPSVDLSLKEDTNTFCESTFLGCFEESDKNNSAVTLYYQLMTIEWCTSYCWSNGYTYAGLKNGATCMCDLKFDNLANKRATSDKCNARCRGLVNRLQEKKGKTETCGGQKSVDGYFIKGKCTQTPFTDEHVKSRKRGCIQYFQVDLHGIPHTAGSSKDCLTICEHQRTPMAIYGAGNKCWCGEVNTRKGLPRQEECNSVDSLEIFRTLAEDKRCGNVRLLPAGQHNRTLMTSYPGSGNTWIRYLLEKATGYYTGSYYTDGEIAALGYLGENLKPEENRTDPLKDHLFNKRPVHASLHSVIMVIRNPYKSVLSFINFQKLKSNRHVGHAMEADIKAAINNRTIDGKMEKWLMYHEKVLASKKPKLVLYYEDIVADPISNVRKMVEFLPNPLLHPKNLEDRLACLRLDLTGFAKRNPHEYSFEIYPKDVRKVINEKISDLRKSLKRAGVVKPLPQYEKDL